MTAHGTYILIADDEPNITSIIGRTIKQMELNPIIVSDGAQAVMAVRTLATHFACAIFDSAMPVMGGIDAALAIRAFAPDLPIILMSASNYVALSQRVALMSHVAFLEKPFRLTDLQSLLDQMLHCSEADSFIS